MIRVYVKDKPRLPGDIRAKLHTETDDREYADRVKRSLEFAGSDQLPVLIVTDTT